MTTVSWMIIPTLSQAHLSCECSAYLVTMYSHFSGKEKLKGEKKITTSPSTSAGCTEKMAGTNNQLAEAGQEGPANRKLKQGIPNCELHGLPVPGHGHTPGLSRGQHCRSLCCTGDLSLAAPDSTGSWARPARS